MPRNAKECWGMPRYIKENQQYQMISKWFYDWLCILVEIAFLIFRNLMQGNILLFVSGKTACLVVTYHHESCQVANFLFRANFDGSDWHPKLDFPLGPSTLNLMVCQSTYNREVKKLNPALKCIKKGFL